MRYDDAIAFIDARRVLGIKPGLDRIAGLLQLMGDPHRAYPSLHVAGSNGKTSTTRLAAAILAGHGLSAGSFTSPPLDRYEDQFTRNGESMGPDDLGTALEDVLAFLQPYEGDGGPQVTEFELATALGFSWLAANSADVAVIEAGLGGRDDATNVLEAPVAVITTIALEHTASLGSTIAEIAANKAGIVADGATLVTGLIPPDADGAMAARVASAGAEWRRFGSDFRIDGYTQAVRGWVVDVDGVYERYDEIFLPLQGRHQAHNLAVACAACESFFGRALDPEATRAAVESVSVPGRLEIVGRTPLAILDVAHNAAGMDALAAALAEEFLPTEYSVVFGVRGDRDPATVLGPLVGAIGHLTAVAADDPLAVPAGVVAAAARELLGTEVPVAEASSVAEAIPHALAEAQSGGLLVTGSHAVVAEARRVMLASGPTPDAN